jgi:hypothetical protein
VTLEHGMEQTVSWYRHAEHLRPEEMFAITCRQIAEYQSAPRLAQA